MKFDVDDKNRCRLVCVKFHQCRFAVAVAKCLGGSLFWGHSVETNVARFITVQRALCHSYARAILSRDKFMQKKYREKFAGVTWV